MVIVVVLLVLLFIAPLFFHLPKVSVRLTYIVVGFVYLSLCCVVLYSVVLCCVVFCYVVLCFCFVRHYR